MIREKWRNLEVAAIRSIFKSMIVRRGGYLCRETKKFHLRDMEFIMYRRSYIFCLQYRTDLGSGRMSSPSLTGFLHLSRAKLKELETRKPHQK